MIPWQDSMKPLLRNQILLALGLALFGLATAGCRSLSPSEFVIGPSYKPANVFLADTNLPSNVRRVVVLPMTTEAELPSAEAAILSLRPVLREELARVKRFETVWATPEQVRQLTGRMVWSAEEKLPESLFKAVRDEFGCDAVMFCRLTCYRPYPPLAVGWRCQLVDCHGAATLWAVDEVFDAREPSVTNAARRYQQLDHSTPAVLADSRSILESPSRFGHYALSSALSTLPGR